MPESHPEASRRNRLRAEVGASSGTARREDSVPEQAQSREAVVERENRKRALQQGVRNRGAAGVDQMPVEQLLPSLKEPWGRIKAERLEGRYQPAPVRKVEIPKPGGGMRMLGIPTAVDRLIQQALHQVLSPLFDPSFSASSYGFRPGRNAQQAVRQARAYVREGRRWVVELDLEKFFDRVNHDVRMARLARRIKDRRLLQLIRRDLETGIMTGGPVTPRREGTPQGGPLSPLLSNLLLDELDKELERRGHRFCRYADDGDVSVRSRSAGERVPRSLTRFLEQHLRRPGNAAKSAVAGPWERKFLGDSMTWHHDPRLKVAREAVARLKEKLRELFRQGRGRNLERFIEEGLNPLLRGWVN